jgi:glycerophosphoryl diester phosphodiesterase
MNLIAHRGFSSKAPENTFASFDMAIKNGFNIIELDVHLTRDKVPIIMHDYKIDRTTNGKGLVKEFNYNDIKKLDAGRWFSKSFKEERVPVLKDVLDKYADNAHLQIELKSYDPDLPQLVIDLINKCGWSDKSNNTPYQVPGFSITSFNLNHVIKAIEISPNFRVGWLLNNVTKSKIIKILSEYNIGMIIPNVHDDIWTDEEFIEFISKKNLVMCAWGAKSESDVSKMKKLGAKAMTVDWPDVAKKFI